jgi:AcrR family transcriptional regulator
MDSPVKPRGRPKDEQLAARRTEEILDVAARLFASRGYRNTDLQVVADELRVGKGTIYRYFPTKRDLFLAAVDRGMQRLSQFIDASMIAQDPAARVEQAIRAYLSFFEANAEFVELLIQERAEFKDRPKPTYFEHRDANLSKWEVLIRQLIATGRVREMRIDTITNVVGDLLYGTMFTNYFSGRQRPLDEQADDILEVVLIGLLTDSERNRVRGGSTEVPARPEP